MTKNLIQNQMHNKPGVSSISPDALMCNATAAFVLNMRHMWFLPRMLSHHAMPTNGARNMTQIQDQ